MSPEAYALRLGLQPASDPGGRPRALYTWVVRCAHRTFLIDPGPADPERAADMGLTGFTPASEALGRIGLDPGQINDVVLSHGHWDLMDGLRDLLHARIWIARAEVEAMGRGAAQGPTSGYRWEDLQRLGLAPRVHLLGRRRQLDPCLRVAVVGGHTPGTMAAVVLTEGRPCLILAGDNLPLGPREGLGQSPAGPPPHDPEGDRLSRFHDPTPRLRQLGWEAPLVPGRDPGLARRFPEIAPGVIRLFP